VYRARSLRLSVRRPASFCVFRPAAAAPVVVVLCRLSSSPPSDAYVRPVCLRRSFTSCWRVTSFVFLLSTFFVFRWSSHLSSVRSFGSQALCFPASCLCSKFVSLFSPCFSFLFALCRLASVCSAVARRRTLLELRLPFFLCFLRSPFLLLYARTSNGSCVS